MTPLSAAVVAVLAGGGMTTASAAPSPVGAEFRVNAFTSQPQELPAVAMDADGDFIVVWQSAYQFSGGLAEKSIYAQRYNAVGVPQGAEFQVDSRGVDVQARPDVAMDADGNFVVVWDSLNQDGSQIGVYAQRFDAAGVPQGSEFRVNTTTALSQEEPAIAMNSDGDFVVTWTGYAVDGSNRNVYGQRYNAAGVPLGAEFRVNTFTVDRQWGSDVAMAADGSFVVAWHSLGQDDFVHGVYAQRYDASGAVQGGEFQVNDVESGNEGSPSVGLMPNGEFLIAFYRTPATGNASEILVKRYDAAGVALGGELQINSAASPAAAMLPELRVLASGDFVVCFNAGANGNIGLGSPHDVFVRRFDADGVAEGAEVRVNTFTDGLQANSALAMNASGNFIVAWQSVPQDGSEEGVYAQRFVGLDDGFDRAPDPFSFTDQADVTASTAVTSTPIIVSGIDAAASISVTGGEYSVNGGAFTGSSGTVVASDTVRVRHTSSATAGTAVNTILLIGGVSDTFTSTTAGLVVDTTPGAFSFTDQADVAASTAVTSNAVTVSGINAPAAISVSGGEYAVNGGAFTSAAGSVNSGDTVRVRHTSSASASSAANTTLTIGGVSDTFTSTTAAAADNTPDAFSFTDQSGATASATVTSNTITVNGINAAAPISITGGEYSVNSGAFTSAAGTVSNGNTVALRLIASAAGGGNASATLTIGGVPDTFNVTTQVTTTAPRSRSGGGSLDWMGLALLLLGLGASRRKTL